MNPLKTNITPTQNQVPSLGFTPQQYQQVRAMLNGRDPKQMFYTLAKQRGVDPNAILEQARQYTSL